ncbi:response regulator receiver modulated diguanylate cyclase/phosphodiesterase with PAS/PAC sensor(s) [Mycolicibacterium tokaiense]|uniref:Response regulator receiver modulated diguanylate cyclase/phosphodiesterase with PAS/PAC sensor(S) n=1 Tax=Mycolicibacterium tokaiense TaxID=39695 RepID=A0A378TIQ7_9MYCO|nr:response regulator receiver modulated diguanylate cyclase/phosphodiesterase with PAS/PAC sensor(s) [Mycolicibacterium tokaiense]
MLVPEAAGEVLTSPQTDPAELHRQVVLVVDDDARLRDLLATVLTPLNCEIVQAASGEEALTLLLQRRVSVIVLDINMPGMDGFETAQLIRDVEELASKPIIFLTGQAEAADLHRGYDLGAVDFLVKPVSRQVFYAKVKALLELDRSFVRLREAAAKLHEQQLQVARAAEIRQRDELAFTRRRERLTNIFAEASIDLASLEQAVVTELSAMFDADCVLRLPTTDGDWHYSLSESDGDPARLQGWLDEHLAGRPCAAPHPAVLVEEMTARSQRVGALCIGRSQAFTETDAALFRGVSVAAALAISNATLYRVAAEYAAVMQATGDAILAVDKSGEIRSCNKAATALFSGEHDALIGRSIVDLAAEDDREHLREQLDVTMATLREHSLEMTLTAFDGRRVDVTITLSPIGESVDLHVAAVVHDLTEIKQAQTEIRHLASHDPLTDLANRRQLNERLAHLARHRDTGSALVAMLYVDVNHFKAVNDTYGHDTGDELLVELAARLRDAVDGDTLVCRVGGDEFIVVFEGVSSTAAAVAMGNRVLAHTQSTPVHCGNVTIQPSLSMGVACLGASAHTPRNCSPRQIWRCSRPSRPDPPSACSTPRASDRNTRARCICGLRSRMPSRARISGWPTSRSSIPRPGHCSRWKPWCGGGSATRRSRPPRSSRSPRMPVRWGRWAAGSSPAASRISSRWGAGICACTSTSPRTRSWTPASWTTSSAPSATMRSRRNGCVSSSPRARSPAIRPPPTPPYGAPGTSDSVWPSTISALSTPA